MLRVGENSKSVNLEFGDSEERLKSSRIVGVLRLLNCVVFLASEAIKKVQEREQNLPIQPCG
jgi:hypothetical protein